MPNLNNTYKLILSLYDQIDSIILVDNTPDVDNYFFFNDLNKCIYLPLKKNKGVAFAQNKGLMKSIEIGSECSILFDQDSIVAENFVVNLFEVFISKKKNKIAAIGPNYIDLKTNKEVKHYNLKGLKAKEVYIDSMSNATELDFIISSGTLFLNSVFQEVGMMRSELFIDVVDTEWCLRAQQYGFKVFLANNIYMQHSIGDQVFEDSNGQTKMMHNNFRKYFIMRNNFYLSLYSNFTLKRKIKFFLNGLFYFSTVVKFDGFSINLFTLFLRSLWDAIIKNMDSGSSGKYL